MRIFYTFVKYSLFFFLISFAFNGCEKKEQKKPEESAQNQQVTPKDTNKVAKADSAKLAKPKEQAPDLTGTWKGEMANRATTLKITKFSDNKFSGSISMAFKDPINQEVSGKFNPDTKTFVMQDLKQHRFQGSYSGKLSEDLKKLSGTFTIKADGQKFNFNLVKK